MKFFRIKGNELNAVVMGGFCTVFLMLLATGCTKADPKTRDRLAKATASQQAMTPLPRLPKSPEPELAPEIEKVNGVPIVFRSGPVESAPDLPDGAEVGELYGRLVGEAKLVHGCLEVSGSAILWERSAQKELKAIIDHLRANRRVWVELGGGSLNAMIDERALREALPSVFLGCPKTKKIWVSHDLTWKLGASSSKDN